MEEVISEYLEGAEFGGKQVDKNMDTIDWLDQGKDHKPSRSDVTIFTKGVLACNVETHDAVRVGTDFRLDSNKLTGFALALEGKVV
jgi:hypothetical protein